MPLIPATAEIPLSIDVHGVVRVSGTRVTLDSVVNALHAGATADEIAQQFPSLPLADVYQVIAYYLNHSPEVESYLARRQLAANDLRKEIETQCDAHAIRARLLARRSAKAT